LVNILDQIRQEAPEENKRYHPSAKNYEGLNQARSRAFIHLYLKVMFGLLDFRDREWFITDGSNDGGIDGYYVDKVAKKIFLIQAKFRVMEQNFRAKEIEMRELLNMDVDRIVDGEYENEFGEPYNGKIKQLIREVSEVSDIGRYKYEVVILAKYSDGNRLNYAPTWAKSKLSS
jgi:hypothetical protein